jgi:ferric-dicitrate binding protein FerR (iron transport regulator)
MWGALATTVVGALAIVGWRTNMGPLSARNGAPVTMYTTANGERANITLPDGSTVALNVASRLEVPASYTWGDRTLRLTGEALFTVQHSDGAPFTVMSGTTTTRVLGTSFLVRHYAADTTSEIAVRDGRVAVRSAVLTAGQRIVVPGQGEPRIGSVTASRFSFATGVLNLDNVTLQDAIPDLNRWYNVDIRPSDSTVALRKISCGFAAGSSHALEEYLTWTMHLRVVRSGRVLTLFSR